MKANYKYNIYDKVEDAFESWAIMTDSIGDLLAYEYIIQYLNKQEAELLKQRLLKIGAKI